MAKFDKAALITVLQGKRDAALENATKKTAENAKLFDAWKAKEAKKAEVEVKRVADLKFEESTGYEPNRPQPWKANTATIDKAIAELECMAGDIVVLTGSSSILDLI